MLKARKTLASGAQDITKVYASKKQATRNELTEGRKVKVSGKCIDHEGEKLLWADRIDLL